MRTINLGFAVAIMGCGGQTLDVGSDPGQGGAGGLGSNTGGGSGYVATAGSGVQPDGMSGSGFGGSGGNDFGGGSGGTGGTGAVGTGVGGGAGSGSFPIAGGGGGTPIGVGGSGGLPFTGEEPTWPAPDGCESDAAGEALVGTWEGALEDFYLQPLLSVRLVINGASERGICGTVTWGDAPEPTATDPAAPYPSQEAWEMGSVSGSVEGYPYTVLQGAAQSGLVRFALDAREGYRPWCAVQEPYALDDGYACLPGRVWESDASGFCQVERPDGEVQLFSSSQCACLNLCDCNESGCFAQAGDVYQYDLTLADGGQTLLGPAPQRVGSPGLRLHFRRVE